MVGNLQNPQKNINNRAKMFTTLNKTLRNNANLMAHNLAKFVILNGF